MAIMDNIDGKAQGQINAINESLGEIKNIYLSNTLGTTSHGKPWLEIEAQFGKMKNESYYNGFVSAGTHYSINGRKSNENFASFTVHSYVEGAIYHVYMSNGVWGHEQLTLNSDLEYTDIPFTATNNASFSAESFIRRRSYDGGVLYNINCTNVSGDVYSLIRIATTTVNPGYTRTFPCHIMDKQGLTKGIGIVMWYGGAIYLTAPVTVETTDTIRAGN